MFRFGCLALVLAAAACSHAQPLPATAAREAVSVEDGKTTAEEVLLEYGIPTARFDGDRIFTYRLVSMNDGTMVPISRHTANGDPRLGTWREGHIVNLVLVFDEHHVLTRHSLVRVR